MINEVYENMLNAKNIIRVLSEFATARGQEIGYDNVFDYSLGNPSVPAPQAFTDEMVRLLREEDPMALHGYSPTLGNPEFKQLIAESLNRRFGMNYTAGHIFPTTGAAGAIAHAVRAVTKPGDTVLTFAPYFPEYNPYITGADLTLSVVPADREQFQINFDAFASMLDDTVAAVLINTPNNPSGVVYSEETLTRLAAMLTDASKRFGRTIFLLSDEPYREIVFDGKEAPYVSKFYDHTLSCYSFSKALSLPGERIGYVAVNPACEKAERIVPMCGQISRGLGHNCPPSIIQIAVGHTCDLTSDLSVYETNRNLLYDKLVSLGYSVVKPGGTFYILPKAMEEDSIAFCEKAKKYDLILVPADGFGAPGFFRMAYCIDTDKVRRSLDALERFTREEYGTC
ncbi:MAG: pyridoxal phosphate-dependent aminotransferase [Lachnospiraceae bacterium]|nr:pyridoxal phosphate-dependent aminotransferase [Lachnospiraceae bacterium]